jgi:alginate O-acetyltransferase complex protein AlgI
MNFVSSEYAILLAVTVALCAVLRGRALACALLIVSVVFYGWWRPAYLWLLAAVIVISWLGAIALERWRSPITLWTVVLGELSLLLYFKYGGFLSDNLRALLSALGIPANVPAVHVVLPAGISFMTFQGIAYAVDVYRRELPAERSLLRVALFKSFFPQLVAGPIERASHLLPQLRRLETRGLADADLARGTFMIFKGVFVKFVIADNMAFIVERVYANVAAASPFDVVNAVLAFSIQIYCDFYGYTMIALGSALLLGVEMVNNFDHPYQATSIQDFWRRWHISLSLWFRDYVYIPLGGSRLGPVRHAANLILVMFAVGLWHGAAWTFVVWGMVHGGMLAGHALVRRMRGPQRSATPVGMFASWLLTIVAVTLAWIPFRAPDLRTVPVVFAKLWTFALSPSAATDVYGYGFYVALAVAFIAFDLADSNYDLEQRFTRLSLAAQGAVLVTCCLLTYLGPAKDVAFLYFQF